MGQIRSERKSSEADSFSGNSAPVAKGFFMTEVDTGPNTQSIPIESQNQGLPQGKIRFERKTVASKRGPALKDGNFPQCDSHGSTNLRNIRNTLDRRRRVEQELLMRSKVIHGNHIRAVSYAVH